jgi:hypothetical protein
LGCLWHQRSVSSEMPYFTHFLIVGAKSLAQKLRAGMLDESILFL